MSQATSHNVIEVLDWVYIPRSPAYVTDLD